MVAGADGHALSVEDRADVVRMHAVEDEGEDARLLPRRPMSRRPSIDASRSVP